MWYDVNRRLTAFIKIHYHVTCKSPIMDTIKKTQTKKPFPHVYDLYGKQVSLFQWNSEDKHRIYDISQERR